MFEKESIANGPGTVVGANVKLKGILKDINDITVHGYIDGEVISEKNVFITESASIKGPVTAEEVVISGKINGAVTANKKLEITPTGKVYGSINTRDLNIKSGAKFVGRSAMIGTESEHQEVQEIDKKSPESKKKDLSKPSSKGNFWKAKDKKSQPTKYELE